MGDAGQIDRFVVEAELGAGASGVVYRAFDPKLQRRVAIKVLASREPPQQATWRTIDLRADPPEGDDLLAEARMMAQLSHPNVLAVFEAGVTDDGVFLVSELVDGTDLRTWVAREPPLPARIDALAQAGRGLTAAHAAGIVHRDFKPDNVLVGNDGRVRVADFGLSRPLRSGVATLRIDGAGGTPPYMAPELWRGELASQASDVYAFATSIVEILAGERPADPADAAARLRGLDRRLAATVVRALDPDPARRPPAAALVSALGTRSRRRWIAAAAAAAAAAVIATGVAVANRRGPACQAAEPPLAGYWDDARRAALLAALVPDRRDAVALGAATAVVQALDRSVDELRELWRTTCAAGDAGDSDAAEVRMRTACLQRRVYAVGGWVAAAIELKPAIGEVADRVAGMTSPEVCLSMKLSPVVRTETPHLYEQLAKSLVADLPRAQRLERLEALYSEAKGSGEQELELELGVHVAKAMRREDTAKADVLLQALQSRATELGVSYQAARILLERTSSARRRGANQEAGALLRVAGDLANAPGMPASTASRVWFALARDAWDRRDPAKARMFLERAEQPHRDRKTTFLVDILVLRSRIETDEKHYDEAIAQGTRAEQLARELSGEYSLAMVDALDALSSALDKSGKRDEARELRQRRLAIVPKLPLPADHPARISHLARVVTDLLDRRDYESALREVNVLVAAAEASPDLQSQLQSYYGYRGGAAWGLGHYDDALSDFRRSFELALGDHGPNHVRTWSYRYRLVDRLLDLDRVEEAGSVFGDVGTRIPTLPARDLASILVVQARLTLQRGDPKQAEALVRRGIAALAEQKETDRLGAVMLGASLGAQGRWREALPVFTEVLERARRTGTRPDETAIYEAWVGRTLYELGDRATGLARLRAAHAELDKSYVFPWTKKHSGLWIEAYTRKPAKKRRPRSRAR